MPKFAVIYSFKVKPGREKDFLNGWKGLTDLIYANEGSFGSRLHLNEDGDYIAYALWPDKETWDNSGDKLPEEADVFSKLMKESCSEISTVYKMEIVADWLSVNRHTDGI